VGIVYIDEPVEIGVWDTRVDWDRIEDDLKGGLHWHANSDYSIAMEKKLFQNTFHCGAQSSNFIQEILAISERMLDIV